MSTVPERVGELYHALDCCNCGVEGPRGATYGECERRAGEAGWVIGLDPDTENADANFACAACADVLINPLPLVPARGVA
ncbi:hypothetical protein L2Y94_05555 [Luteibacter aegosomatis]|uniref:hypothetical protein n=1 Tax=Luteibacter aegosomatis TaxID=2911537 RepID=UPI001FF91C8D|nr:hypothetical protein [Luteibacter aegosomatis]UPG86820.1 hypothetical protein L2Y94_05555 [Luteibacter aegosomatis]